MCIFWRYLLRTYVKVFFLAIFSFITILLVSRLEEIAHFASIGAPLSALGLFALFQIPYVLPIAIPISCLISAMILFQNLSHTSELTALRAGGIPLRQVLAPVLIVSSFLSLGNFYISSELATASHLATKRMLNNLTSVNPLVLLQNACIAKLQGAYVQMDPIRNGEAVKDVVIAMQGRNKERLSMLMAKKISMVKEELVGENVSFITSLPSAHADSFDDLMVENQAVTKCSASQFAPLLRKQGWKIANDNLRFSLLRLRIDKIKRENAQPFPSTLQKCYSEISRRLCLCLAPLTFSLMGIAFGMEISRERSKRGIITVLLLAGATLMTFFVAKELDHLFWVASALFLLPHLIIASSALFWLSRINRGVE